MNAFHKLRVLLVVGIIVVMGASLGYVVLTTFNTSTQHPVAKLDPTTSLKSTATLGTNPTEVTEPPVKPCSSKQRDFQMPSQIGEQRPTVRAMQSGSRNCPGCRRELPRAG